MLASTSLAGAAPRFHTRDTMWYRVDMDSATVVPRAAAPKTARGFFAAKLVIVKWRPLATLAWRLELSGLSSPSTSRAVEAHIHTGRPGTVGPEVIRLCGPCEPHARGSTTLPAALARQISGSNFWPGGPERAYVDVHTRRNPRGEIRGSLVESAWRGDYRLVTPANGTRRLGRNFVNDSHPGSERPGSYAGMTRLAMSRG